MNNAAITKAMNLTADTFIDAVSRGTDPAEIVSTLTAGLEKAFGENAEYVLKAGLVLAENKLVSLGMPPSPTKIGAIAAGFRLAA